MCKGRYRETKGMIEDELTRCIRQVFFCPYDVGNVHECIVEYDAVVVYRNAIGFDNNKIADFIGVERNVAPYEVVKFQCFILWRLYADNIGTTFGQILLYRFRCKVRTFAGIDRCFALSHLCFFFGFQFFRCAEAIIGFAFSQELVRIFFIEVQPFHLTVRAVRTTYVNAFIPVNAQPFQGILNIFFRFARRTFLVRIFDPDDKRATCMLGKQVVKEGRAGTANMKRAGRARSKANAYFIRHEKFLP